MNFPDEFEKVECATCLWYESGLPTITRIVMAEAMDVHMRETGHRKYRVISDGKGLDISVVGAGPHPAMQSGKRTEMVRRIAHHPTSKPLTILGLKAPDIAAEIVNVSPYQVTIVEADSRKVTLHVQKEDK